MCGSVTATVAAQHLSVVVVVEEERNRVHTGTERVERQQQQQQQQRPLEEVYRKCRGVRV